MSLDTSQLMLLEDRLHRLVSERIVRFWIMTAAA